LIRAACLKPTMCLCPGYQAHRRMPCPLRMAALQRPHGASRFITSCRPAAVKLQTQGSVALPVPGHQQQSPGFHLCDPWFNPLASFQWSRGHPGTLRFPQHLPGRPHPGRSFFYRPPWRVAFLSISSAWPLCALRVCSPYLFGSCPQCLRGERGGQERRHCRARSSPTSCRSTGHSGCGLLSRLWLKAGPVEAVWNL